MEQLCDHKGEPMLFYVQRKLDVSGTPDRKTWRSIGRVMKISSDDLDLIETAYKADKSPTEILLAKFKTFTPEPTMKEFVQALVICQRNDVASYICNWQWEKLFKHRRTGTFGPGRAVTLLPEKNTQCPKACVVQLTYSSHSKNKNVHISDV